MKKILIKNICVSDPKQDPRDNYLYKTLSKYYQVEFSDTPQYLFYDHTSMEYLKYDCIRIFTTGENITPNFNFCDYAIGYDYMSFEDRYYRFPIYLHTSFYHPDELRIVGENYLTTHETFRKEDLEKKQDFCSFVYSNYLADDSRRVFFELLNTYKQVHSGGAYHNNIGGRVSNKLAFESRHKFSIAFENTARSGYTTEKLVSALVAKTIPIYWGNPNIALEFNEKRFINCHKYDSFEEVLGRVIEIDKNDDLYIRMMNEPLLADMYDIVEVKKGFANFLRNICDQPIDMARRRTKNSAIVLELEKNELLIGIYANVRVFMKRMLAILYRPFKKIKAVEVIKMKYFKKKLLKKI